MLSPTKIVEFKHFSRLLSDFPVVFKEDLIFKTFQECSLNSSTFQACANPVYVLKSHKLSQRTSYFLTSSNSPGRWCHLILPSFPLRANVEKCVSLISSVEWLSWASVSFLKTETVDDTNLITYTEKCSFLLLLDLWIECIFL